MRALAKTLYPELTRLHSCLSPCPSPCPGPLRPCPACCSFCPRAHSPFFRPRHVQFCFTHLGFGPKLGLGACSQKPICWDDRKGAPLRRLAAIIELIFAAAVQPMPAAALGQLPVEPPSARAGATRVLVLLSGTPGWPRRLAPPG